MTEIDVPDWVVEAGVQAMQTVTHWDSHEDFRQKVSQAVITAALGAWVVKVGIAEVEKLSERTSSYDITPRDWSFYLSDGNHTLLTLRQEKPE